MTTVTWGANGPPRHEDGRAVITARLRERLTPIELDLLTGDALVRRVAASVQWRTGGQSIDGWDPEDFVQYGLAEAARYTWATPAAIVTWVGREIDRARKRAERRPVLERPEGPDFVPSVLPESVAAWLDRWLHPNVAVAIRLIHEQGLTSAEAARKVGIDRKRIDRAYDKLRGKLR